MTHNQPLGKPEGTVRAYLALIVVGTFAVAHVLAAGALIVTGHITEGVALLGALALEAATVTGFYFGNRTSSEPPGPTGQK